MGTYEDLDGEIMSDERLCRSIWIINQIRPKLLVCGRIWYKNEVVFGSSGCLSTEVTKNSSGPSAGEAAENFEAVVAAEGPLFSQATNGSLVLQHTKTTDAGWYLCRAANSVGKPISKIVQLIVHGKFKPS